MHFHLLYCPSSPISTLFACLEIDDFSISSSPRSNKGYVRVPTNFDSEADEGKCKCFNEKVEGKDSIKKAAPVRGPPPVFRDRRRIQADDVRYRNHQNQRTGAKRRDGNLAPFFAFIWRPHPHGSLVQAEESAEKLSRLRPPTEVRQTPYGRRETKNAMNT